MTFHGLALPVPRLQLVDACEFTPVLAKHSKNFSIPDSRNGSHELAEGLGVGSWIDCFCEIDKIATDKFYGAAVWIGSMWGPSLPVRALLLSISTRARSNSEGPFFRDSLK